MAHRIGPLVVLLTAFATMFGAYLALTSRAVLVGWIDQSRYGILSCRYYHPPAEIETRTWTATQIGQCPWIVRR